MGKQLQQILDEEEEKLTVLTKTLLRNQKKEPQGSLRISQRSSGQGKRARYYKNLNGTCSYLSSKNLNEAIKLAQKDYEHILLKNSKKCLKSLRDLTKTYRDLDPEKVFDKLIAPRKALVDPLILSDDEYARQWQSRPYEGKSFDENDIFYITDRGEKVRSKSEKIIADSLFRLGIPYKYECPLQLEGLDRPVYPDFTVLNKRTRKEKYWEHNGMMNDPKYVGVFLRKQRLYERNGLYPGDALLMTFEGNDHVLSVTTIDDMIRIYLI